MSIVSDVVGGVLGKKSANKAGDAQTYAADQAIVEAQRAEGVARADLQPFREAGQSVLESLGNLITSPTAQKKYIEKNPFFEALANRASKDLLQATSAKGKMNSGGTAEALQNSLLLLGSDLVNQRINNSFNLANLGQASAARQANATQVASNSISDSVIGVGNARAAQYTAQGQANQQIAGGVIGGLKDFASLAALSDVRVKENIEHIGFNSLDLPVYKYNYAGINIDFTGMMAQDVEIDYPDCVFEIDGLKFINLGALLCH